MREMIIAVLVSMAIGAAISWYVRTTIEADKLYAQQLKTRIQLRSLRRKARLSHKNVVTLKGAHDKDYTDFLDSLFNEEPGSGTPPTMH
jgi:hypothetical protein